MISKSVAVAENVETVRPLQSFVEPAAAEAMPAQQTINTANCSSCGGCGSAIAKCGGMGGPTLATDPNSSAFGGALRPRSVNFGGLALGADVAATNDGQLQILRGGLPPYGMVSVRASKDGGWDVALGTDSHRPLTRLELQSLQLALADQAKKTPASNQVAGMRKFASALAEKVKQAELDGPSADARVTSDARQKANMLVNQLSAKSNGAANDAVRLFWDGRQTQAEMVVRRVFDGAEMAGLVKDIRAIGDQSVQAGLIDELERQVDQQRVELNQDARTELQGLATELGMGKQALTSAADPETLGVNGLRNLVAKASQDGVITHAELMDLINGSESVAQLDAEVRPLVGSFDGVAKQQWQRLFGVANAAPLAPTPDNLEGPFYVPNAPFRADGMLAGPNEAGKKLEVTGKVLDKDGKPIANATVDVWSANEAGDYMDMRGPGRPSPNPSFRLRGKVTTDAEGNYKFTTIVPGNYRLDPNNPQTVRPKHVHVKVSAPGHEMLTTQLYSKDDMEHNETDPVGIFLKELLMDDRDVNGTQVGTFDFVLL